MDVGAFPLSRGRVHLGCFPRESLRGGGYLASSVPSSCITQKPGGWSVAAPRCLWEPFPPSRSPLYFRALSATCRDKSQGLSYPRCLKGGQCTGALCPGHFWAHLQGCWHLFLTDRPTCLPMGPGDFPSRSPYVGFPRHLPPRDSGTPQGHARSGHRHSHALQARRRASSSPSFSFPISNK